jgi:pimeloyl-ACP methyl ester carboxylesterase
MNYFVKIILILLYICISTSQIIEEHSLFDEYGNEVDVFAYQIPENYNPNNAHPLLVAFHQWGGNQMSPFSTQFDEEAYARNWIFMSPFGGSSNNYNHQDAQEWVKQGIQWLQANYNIDERRIYMVGGSMGGAAGAIYANNHLDPTEPMVAATASASGILDCERRAIEMDGNNSMIEWFGGDYDEVPFEYHRNSAVYFADSTQSLHYNLQYTPLYLDFGVTETHRTHAEDLYNLLINYNDNMWIDTIPTGSHGYSVIDELHTCDWFSQFELEDNPSSINVNLDEPGRAYWLEVKGQFNDVEFIRVNAVRNGDNNLVIYKFSNSDSIIFHNTINISNTELLIDHEFINNEYYIGLSGNDINFINEINATGIIDDYFEPLNINIQNQIVWISVPDFEFENIEIVISYFSTDVNQDEIWDVLDIVLTVNFIMGYIEPTAVQFDSADLNVDNVLDVLDIIIMVNMIMGQ